ncbi:MAG: Hsp70 family protein, partial [Oscillospiraceae bacterium]
EIENKNTADSAAYQAEKLIKDMGDKLDANDKSEIETKIADLRAAITANNHDEMKSKREVLEKKLYEVSSKIYEATGAQQGAAPDMGGAEANPGKPDDGVVDADYTEVE